MVAVNLSVLCVVVIEVASATKSNHVHLNNFTASSATVIRKKKYHYSSIVITVISTYQNEQQLFIFWVRTLCLTLCLSWNTAVMLGDDDDDDDDV